MAKEFAKGFYNSKSWQKARASYISYRVGVDGGMCETCGQELGYIVHHKTKLTADNINDPTVTTGFGNLKYECKKCHDIEHYGDMHKKAPKETRCTFDDKGNPVPKSMR